MLPKASADSLEALLAALPLPTVAAIAVDRYAAHPVRIVDRDEVPTHRPARRSRRSNG